MALTNKHGGVVVTQTTAPFLFVSTTNRIREYKNMLSRVLLTKEGVRIGNWIY
jgi:hypothetical protein